MGSFVEDVGDFVFGSQPSIPAAPDPTATIEADRS